MSVVLESFKDGVKTIKINRPERKNAFNFDTYTTLTKILNEDDKNDKIVVTILTGVGEYFSSGTDLKGAFITTEMDELLKSVSDMVEAFINYSKLIICVVNGPAIGIGATVVALCDVVYAIDKAVFDTPFLKIGVGVECCSSYTFPLTLGKSVASEMIFLGKKLSAQEALELGFISKIVPCDELPNFIMSLHQYGKLPLKSVKINKAAIMSNFKDIFKQVNKTEFKYIKESVYSKEFAEGIKKFNNRKSKL